MTLAMIKSIIIATKQNNNYKMYYLLFVIIMYKCIEVVQINNIVTLHTNVCSLKKTCMI